MKILLLFIVIFISPFLGCKKEVINSDFISESYGNDENDGLFCLLPLRHVSFPGGDTAWKNWLIENFNCDSICDTIKPGKYQFLVEFSVDSSGNVFKVNPRHLSEAWIEKKIIDIFEKSPKWAPEIGYNGVPVETTQIQPMVIIVPN